MTLWRRDLQEERVHLRNQAAYILLTRFLSYTGRFDRVGSHDWSNGSVTHRCPEPSELLAYFRQCSIRFDTIVRWPRAAILQTSKQPSEADCEQHQRGLKQSARHRETPLARHG